MIFLGGSGLVGSRLRAVWARDAEILAPTHTELDVLDAKALEAFIASAQSDSVVNLAAWADVDGAEPERGDTRGVVYRLNVEFPRQLARLCAQTGKHLVHISTDYVFDGVNAEKPYSEEDQTAPLCWYAQTKRDGEVAIQGVDPTACIARIEMPYTAARHAKRDLARLVATRLSEGQTVQGVTDQRITPVLLDDAAAAVRKLAEARYSGVVHVAASDWTTPYDFARGIARRLKLEEDCVLPVEFAQFAVTRPALRPQHSWLDVTRFANVFGDAILKPVDEALDMWSRQWRLP
ncbi:MAG: sugar nucleotide-binding protein [Chloroflexi bacterium]|nr:sugar nucleotide-binding protein [Chloroflexota bacterium]